MDLQIERDGGAVHLFVLENFNGELFEQIDGYRADMLAAVADLQRRAVHTDEFGGLRFVSMTRPAELFAPR